MEKWQAMFSPDGLSDDLAKLRFELGRTDGVRGALEDYLYSLWASLLSKARHHSDEKERLYYLAMAESLANLSGSLFSEMKYNPITGKLTTNTRNIRV